jgi:hypothetical protein
VIPSTGSVPSVELSQKMPGSVSLVQSQPPADSRAPQGASEGNRGESPAEALLLRSQLRR